MTIKFHFEPGAVARFLRTVATIMIVGCLGYVLIHVMDKRDQQRPVVITTVPTAPVILENAPEISAPLPLPDLPPPPPINPDPPVPAKIDPIVPPLRGPEDVKPVRPLKSGKSIARNEKPSTKPTAATRQSTPTVPDRQSNWATTVKIAQHTNPPSQAQLNIITGQWMTWPGDGRF